jgi:hypothetical protein
MNFVDANRIVDADSLRQSLTQIWAYFSGILSMIGPALAPVRERSIFTPNQCPVRSAASRSCNNQRC